MGAPAVGRVGLMSVKRQYRFGTARLRHGVGIVVENAQRFRGRAALRIEMNLSIFHFGPPDTKVGTFDLSLHEVVACLRDSRNQEYFRVAGARQTIARDFVRDARNRDRGIRGCTNVNLIPFIRVTTLNSNGEEAVIRWESFVHAVRSAPSIEGVIHNLDVLIEDVQDREAVG